MIEVEICTGTTCYVLGAAELLEQLDRLCGKYPDRIRVSGISCEGFCRIDAGEKPPYVRINGRRISGVSGEGLSELLQTELGERLC